MTEDEWLAEEFQEKRPHLRAVVYLNLAETLVRTRGYNGFSYRDLAEQIGIKTASIHYRFPHQG